MKPKVWIIVTLLGVITVGMIAFLYWNSPDHHIRAVLSDSEAAIEAKDLDRAMNRFPFGSP